MHKAVPIITLVSDEGKRRGFSYLTFNQGVGGLESDGVIGQLNWGMTFGGSRGDLASGLDAGA